MASGESGGLLSPMNMKMPAINAMMMAAGSNLEALF
jgi:hypothetical protein